MLRKMSRADRLPPQGELPGITRACMTGAGPRGRPDTREGVPSPAR